MRLFGSAPGKEREFSDLRKYVNDFEITETTDQNGKKKKTVIYKGTWTILKEASSRTFCKLWAALALSAGLAAMYIRMMLITHLTSGQFTAMIPLLAGLFPVMYLMMGAAALPFRGKPMRRDQYMHSFIRVSRSCVAVIVCVVLAQIASLIFRISGQDWNYFREDWLFTGYSLAVIIAAAGTIFLLRSVDVIEKENGEA